MINILLENMHGTFIYGDQNPKLHFKYFKKIGYILLIASYAQYHLNLLVSRLKCLQKYIFNINIYFNLHFFIFAKHFADTLNIGMNSIIISFKGKKRQISIALLCTILDAFQVFHQFHKFLSSINLFIFIVDII